MFKGGLGGDSSGLLNNLNIKLSKTKRENYDCICNIIQDFYNLTIEKSRIEKIVDMITNLSEADKNKKLIKNYLELVKFFYNNENELNDYFNKI